MRHRHLRLNLLPANHLLRLVNRHYIEIRLLHRLVSATSLMCRTHVAHGSGKWQQIVAIRLIRWHRRLAVSPHIHVQYRQRLGLHQNVLWHCGKTVLNQPVEIQHYLAVVLPYRQPAYQTVSPNRLHGFVESRDVLKNPTRGQYCRQ